jgi:hypothetical protein
MRVVEKPAEFCRRFVLSQQCSDFLQDLAMLGFGPYGLD